MRFLPGMLCCLVFASVAVAQETTGDLRGRVTATGVALANARVTASGPALQAPRVAQSGPDGVFMLRALPPGRYVVRIASIGYRAVELRDIAIVLGRTQGLEAVSLDRAQVELAPVVIQSPRLTVDPVRTTVGATLDASDLAALPGDHDFKALIATIPHVNTSYNGDAPNAAGSTGLENMYFVDGVNVTSPFRASSGTNLPPNFVKSVEVRAGGYEAQFGRALGAIVNAVTYTGSNTVESNVFGFFNHSALAATSKSLSSLKETGGMSYDVGVRVSGPIVRDKLWYSAAYNPRLAMADREIIGFGSFVDRSRIDIFAGKATWQASSATTVELSVLGDPATHHAVEPPSYLAGNRPLNPDPFLQLSETGGLSGALRATSIVGPAIVEASIGRASARENLTGDTPTARSEPPFVDWRAGTLGGGMPFPSIISQSRTTLMLRTTLGWGVHTSVAGIEYEDASVSNRGSPPQLFLDAFGADSFRLGTSSIVGLYHNYTPTAYAQDAWRLSSRLTVNLGLRWSQQRFSAAGLGDGQHFNGEWQPRAGFSWLADERGTGRFFGSYGRFYQELPLNIAVLYLGDFVSTVGIYKSDPRITGSTPDTTLSYSTPASWYLNSDDAAGADRFDEFTLGYERQISAQHHLTLRAMYRTLGAAYQQGIDPNTVQYFFLGTPGKGDLSFLPKAKRDYTALEMSWRGAFRHAAYSASYVLSRTWGNYPGQFGSDFYFGNPGIDYGLTVPEQAKNSTGLLPNDRTHVFKLHGTYQVTPSLQLGSVATLQSGTPLNEFGASPECSTCLPVFLVPRGSAGRTPWNYDLNFRGSYELRATRGKPRVVLDVLHVGNPQTVVRRDQQRYNEVDASGSQLSPNAHYQLPLLYQPPMAAKLGVEVRF